MPKSSPLTAPDAPAPWSLRTTPQGAARSGRMQQVADKAALIAQRTLLWLGIWLLLGFASVVLFILGLTGHGYAWGLLLLLIVATVAGLWLKLQQVGQQVQQRLEGSLGSVLPTAAGPQQQRMTALGQTKAKFWPLLSAQLRQRLEQASNATIQALQATTAAGLLTREAHEARSAADHDIPQALAAYERLCQAGGSVSYAELMLSEQLGLITERMNHITQLQRHEQARDLEAQSLYLQDKYQS